MLQMRPWKMSLLLQGNNNSKFQLLLTLQSSLFPWDSESERASIDGFFLNSLSAPPHSCSSCSPFSALPQPPPHPNAPPHAHHPPPPLPSANMHPTPALSPAEAFRRQRLVSRAGPLSPWQDTTLWAKCLPHHFLSVSLSFPPSSLLPLISSLPF